MKSNKALYILMAVFAILIGFSLVFFILYKMNSKKPPTSTTPPPTIYNLFRQKEMSGAWDEKTLIIENLKIFAGEKTTEQVYGVKKVKVGELTPLQRRAQHYLQYGDDETAKKEIRRLMDKVFPDLNKLLSSFLDKSQPVKISLQDLLIPPAYAQTRRCIGSECYLEYDIPSQGYANKMFIHTLIEAGDDFRSAISSAVSDSLATYHDLSLTTRKIYVLVVPGANPEDSDADASAANENVLGENVCRVQVWYWGIQSYIENPAAFKQILAHEIFHCVEDDNYMRQYRVPPTAATDWWAEGGAEYFSNVVYPSANGEYVYNGDFDSNSPNTPIHRMSYEANVFLQYLANETGNAGVLSLFSSLPTSGSFDEQEAALSTYPNMNNIFHHFGEHYLDNQIADTGGGNRPLHPTYADTDRVTDTHTYAYSSEPFVLTRKKMIFDPGNKQLRIRTEEDNPGKYSAEKQGTETWGNLPESIGNFSCDDEDSDSSTYKVLLTNAQSGHTEYQLTVNVTAEGGASESAPAGVDTTQRDACLYGKWRIDPASAENALQQLFSRMQSQGINPQITSFNMNAEMCMKRQGTYVASLDYSVNTSTVMPRSSMTMLMDMIIRMGTQAPYAANGSVLTFWNPVVDFSSTVHISINGRSRTTTAPYIPRSGPTQLNYTCRGSDMDIQIPMDPFPMVHMNKVTRSR